MANAKKTTNNATVIVNKIQTTQITRNAIDIGKWRSAHKAAENITTPKLKALYDIYNDVLLDPHLTGILQKRKSTITNTSVAITNNGKQNEVMQNIIKNPAFTDFLNDVLDTKFWGFSLFEFMLTNGQFNYQLIPRNNVIPSNGLVVINPTDTTGIDFNDPIYQTNIVAVGKANDLGYLLQASPLVIYKRKCMADYAQYIERFGMPIVEGTYDGMDEAARIKLHADLIEYGSSQTIVHPEGTVIKFIEDKQRTGSAELYSKMIELCNTELSKLILGNTLTTQQGENGARSLGDVHQHGEDNINQSDKLFVLNVLNYQLKPLLIANGFPLTADDVFDFHETESIDYTKSIDIDMKLNSIINIDADYFYDKYKVPKPTQGAGYKAVATPVTTDATAPTKPKRGAKKLSDNEEYAKRFF
jgi:phage gp29-like protein